MKVEEIIQRIQSLYSKGVQSDDSRLKKRHIYNKLLSVRSRLVAQEARKKRKISEWNYQTINCIELIKVPAHECPCLPPAGCDILRSRYKIPKPLMGISDNLIKLVSTIDRSIKIGETSVNKVDYSKGNKYTSSSLKYFILDGYLYLVSNTNLRAILMVGLFEDPVEVSKFTTLCEDCVECQECFEPLEQDFPIDLELVEALIELTVTELVGAFSQVGIEDLTNNSRDSLKEQSK